MSDETRPNSADCDAALVQVGYLELLARQVREQGDVQQVLLSPEGVSQTHSLADELWMIAYNLRTALTGPRDTAPGGKS